MARIDKLPPDLEMRLPEIRNEWLDIGLSTAIADRAEAERGVDEAYRTAGLNPPKMKLWFRSPFEGAVAAASLQSQNTRVRAQVRAQVGAQVGAQVWDQVRAQVRAQVWDQVGAQVWDQVGAQVWDQVGAQVRAQVRAQVWAAIYGQHEAAFFSFLYTFTDVVPDVARMTGLFRVARSAGWWWAFRDVVVLTDRPKTVRLSEDKLLHCEDGPAIEYRDGFAVYAWRGTRIPAEWITEPETLTAKTALTHDNIEQRRCACEIIGWSKILRELNAETVDADPDPQIGTLIQVPLPDLDGKHKFLRVQCGTGREFAVGIPPEVNTALEAQAWMVGLPKSEFKIPEVRT